MKAIAVAIRQSRVIVEKNTSEPSRMKSSDRSSLFKKLVVKTKRVEQVMNVRFQNLAKKVSSTWIQRLTKDESH